jgi:hypothetical protein
MTIQTAGVSHADNPARAQAAGLLARYPELSEAEFDRLHHWFRREAGPLDVGLLASDPAIAEPYRAYRKRHHDRFTPRDMAVAAGFVVFAVGIFGGIVMMVP